MERFHEETMRLDTGEAIGDGLLLRFLKRKRVMQRAGDEVGKGAEQQDFLLREVHWRGGLDVENAVKLLGVENRESNGCYRIRQKRLQAAVGQRPGAENGHVAVARNVAHQAGAEWDALAERAAARAGFRLDDDFARRVIQRADADVVVNKPGLQLLGDFGEHLVGIQRGDSVARDGVEQGQVPRLGALLVKETRVFDSDAGFAGQHAEQLEVTFVEGALVFREHRHGADGMVVSHQGNAAEAAAGANGFDPQFFYLVDVILPDQHRLPRSNQILGKVISCRARAPGHAVSGNDFQIKTKFVAERVQLGDVEVFHVEQPAQFFPDFLGEVFLLQRGAQDAADFVEHVQLFRAAGSLLDQVAVLDGHADLMAQRKQEA